MTTQPIAALTVLIADHSEIFRRGITRAIQDVQDIDSIWDGEPEKAIEVAEALQPDVALVDIGLPHQRGLKVAWQIRMRNPATATIILSPYEDDAQVFQSVKIGASAFSAKDTPAETLLEQIREVGNGANLISESIQSRPGVASQMIQQFESYSLAGIEIEKLVSPLTNRESQVLSMISQGHGNKQIAASLGINEQTVKNQMSGIMAKLHANNRTHAVVLALNSGWLDLPSDATTTGQYPSV